MIRRRKEWIQRIVRELVQEGVDFAIDVAQPGKAEFR
jgi:hypothetical protein